MMPFRPLRVPATSQMGPLAKSDAEGLSAISAVVSFVGFFIRATRNLSLLFVFSLSQLKRNPCSSGESNHQGQSPVVIIWACAGVMQASKHLWAMPAITEGGKLRERIGRAVSSPRGAELKGRRSESKHLRERANCTVMPAQPRRERARLPAACTRLFPPSLLLQDIQEMLSSKIGGWEIFLRPTPFLSDIQNSRGPRRCRN